VVQDDTRKGCSCWQFAGETGSDGSRCLSLMARINDQNDSKP
jgi:hypothetical protein